VIAPADFQVADVEPLHGVRIVIVTGLNVPGHFKLTRVFGAARCSVASEPNYAR
jgi:hypothetical protein